MNDAALELIRKRRDEIIKEAQMMLVPYNARLAELAELEKALQPPEETETGRGITSDISEESKTDPDIPAT